MVNFIPHPDLQQVIPPLLSHIPAAFSSPKAPPSLPPLLAPILRSRVEHLSFGNTPWLQLLTWGSADEGERLYSHLLEQDYFFLHDSPSVVQSSRTNIKGFRRLDADTIHLAVDVSEIGLRLKFLFVINDDNGEDDGWKLLDVRLLEDAEEEERGNANQEDHVWSRSIGEAEEAFRSDGFDAHEGDEKCNRLRTLNQALGGGAGHFILEGMQEPSSPTHSRQPSLQQQQHSQQQQQQQNDEDSDDDYWGRYDEVDGSSSRGDEHESNHSTYSPSSAARDDADYYSRYNDVQPSMDVDDPEPRTLTPPPVEESSATPMPFNNTTISSNTTTTNTTRDTTIHESDASTRSTSSSPARSNLSTPLTVQTSPTNNNLHRSSSVIAKLERQAELNVQAETAIKQHVATSMKSLFRLWRAAGLDREEFERTVNIEIEFLGMMDDDDGSFGSA